MTASGEMQTLPTHATGARAGVALAAIPSPIQCKIGGQKALPSSPARIAYVAGSPFQSNAVHSSGKPMHRSSSVMVKRRKSASSSNTAARPGRELHNVGR